MAIRIGHVTILVRDQDEAFRFYTEKLGMEKREEVTTPSGSRWLTVAPPGQREVAITLRQPEGADLARVGNQTGGEFVCILHTDDCRRAYESLKARGVRFVRPPQDQPFGVIATFEDLYGNLLDLWEPREG